MPVPTNSPPILPLQLSAQGTLAHWRQTNQAITLEINDSLRFSITDQESFRLLAELVERLDTLAALREGLQDFEQGRTMSLEEFQHRFGAQHEVSR